MTAPTARTGDGGEAFAFLAGCFLDDATHTCLGEQLAPQVQALTGIGYAVLALREQLAEQPPRRRWLRRGGAS